MGGSRPHKQGATIYAVADHAGVSIATVSRFLSDPGQVREVNRRRVAEAVEALGYEPLGAAQTLAARSHRALGLIVPEIAGQYYADLIAGFELAAGERDLSVVLVIAAGRRDLMQAARRLATRVDGLAIMASTGLPRSGIDTLAARVPTIVVAGDPSPGVHSLRVESIEAACSLTERLLAAGRRRLFFVGDPAIATDARDRYAGFCAAHTAYGLPEPEALLVPFDQAGGGAAAATVLEMPVPPDGLVCANDLLALELIDRLLEHGRRIPDDIAVTGWDDLLAARYIRPRLTTVRQPVRELAALAAERLHGFIVGAHLPSPDQDVIACDVVVRESCGTNDSILASANRKGSSTS